ncbi:MAG: hypothetical protein JXR10_10990 [Cyclobacteriaceae bacterium]
MPGRRPIFATLMFDLSTLLRDGLYKALLEPASHADRKKKESKNKSKKDA